MLMVYLILSILSTLYIPEGDTFVSFRSYESYPIPSNSHPLLHTSRHHHLHDIRRGLDDAYESLGESASIMIESQCLPDPNPPSSLS